MINIITNTLKRRVVVTGMGIVSPLGNNVDENWDNLVKGKIGIRDLSKEKYSDLLPKNCKIGGTINQSFNNNKYKTLGTDNLLTQMTMCTVEQAMDDSKLIINSKKDIYRTGVIIGSSLGSLHCLTDSISKAYKDGYTHINRMLMLKILINLLSANISIKYKLKGPISSPSLACATGLNAIGDSYKIITNNEADIMICGGSEASIHPLVFHSMNKLSTLCNEYDNPSSASRPFDTKRKGFVIGEGSGVIILEELNHALERQASIYCEVVGYSSVSDGHHLTRPTDDGEGGFRSMMNACIENSISPFDIDLVNCHATSTQTGDLAELNAIKNFFGNEEYKDFNNLLKNYQNFEFNLNNENINTNRLKNLKLNANKSQIGHLLAAAGSVELIFMILSLKNQAVPINQNLDEPISDLFDLQYKLRENQMINYAIKNSFAFGGVNSSIIIKKYN